MRRGPPPPTGPIRLLRNFGVELAFREIVRRLLPEEADTILAAGRHRLDSDAERAYAFCAAIERQYFPIYECEEIEGLVYSVPFYRMGWSYDDFHDLDRRPGTLLLRALCAEPYESNVGARVPLLEAVEALGVPSDVLERVPADGIPPAQLHKALDKTRHAAAAEFADWTWGETGSVFLDCDDEVEVVDTDWSDETVQELVDHWRAASALMERVYALEGWLEKDPASNFAQLLEVALAVAPVLAISGSDDEHETNSPELDCGVPDPAIALSRRVAA
jgi:hypothetical protein